jgi:hypothetical protein
LGVESLLALLANQRRRNSERTTYVRIIALTNVRDAHCFSKRELRIAMKAPDIFGPLRVTPQRLRHSGVDGFQGLGFTIGLHGTVLRMFGEPP